MRTRIVLLLGGGLLALFLGSTVASAQAEIVLCHVPPNPDISIVVANQAVANAHLKHGDYLGLCLGNPATPIPEPTATDPPEPTATDPPQPTPTEEEPPPDPTPTKEPSLTPTPIPDSTPIPPEPTATAPEPQPEAGSHEGNPGGGLWWLLTNSEDGRWCVLVAESHPSVERQNIKCFPGLVDDWSATNAPCAGFVSDADVWKCDQISREWRLEQWPDAPWIYDSPGRWPVEMLRQVYQAHLDKWGDDHQ